MSPSINGQSSNCPLKPSEEGCTTSNYTDSIQSALINRTSMKPDLKAAFLQQLSWRWTNSSNTICGGIPPLAHEGPSQPHLPAPAWLNLAQRLNYLLFCKPELILINDSVWEWHTAAAHAASVLHAVPILRLNREL